MHDADTRLAGLALSWLSTRSTKKPGTRTDLQTALFPFVQHRHSRAEWKERCESLVEGLIRDGHVAAGGRNGARLELTSGGRAQVLSFLGLDAPPRGLTWAKLKATYLLARSLDLPPANKAVQAQLANADGVRAALLKRQHDVDGEQTPTLSEVEHRLLWRQLGVETDRAFTLKAVRAHLLGKLLETEVSDPDKAVEQLAARAAGATRVDAEAVRLATLRNWLLATPPALPRQGGASSHEPAPPRIPSTPPTASGSPAAFAEHVLTVARALPTGRFGSDKVFISHVWRALQPEWSNREAFNAALLEASRTRLLELTRADLVSAMDPTDVAESEIRSYGATFHFVVV